MKKLLEIEWMKVKGYRTFWILSSLYLLAIIGINYISFYINSSVTSMVPGGGVISGNPYAFPNVWLTVSWMSSWVIYLPGFMMIFLVTNEYTFKTHRQNIIDGLDRKDFVKTKLAVAGILALAVTLVIFLTSLIIGLASGTTISFENFYNIGYSFIGSLVYILFALLLAFLLRKAALAVGLFFIYGLIIDNLAVGLLRKSFDGKPYGSYFLPLDVADGMLPFPFFKNQVDMVLKSPNAIICLVISLAWIVFYNWFTVNKFNKEDL